MLHRARLTHHPAALAADGGTGAANVFHPEGDVAVGIPQLVGAGVPVVGELQHRLLRLRPVTQEGQGEAATGVLLAPQQLHAEHIGVEGNGPVQIPDPEHGVEHPHGARFPDVNVQAFWPGANGHNARAGGDP